MYGMIRYNGDPEPPFTSVTWHGRELVANDSEPFKQKATRQVSNIRRTLAGNKIVDNSDVVGASPVGAAPTTSSFST